MMIGLKMGSGDRVACGMEQTQQCSDKNQVKGTKDFIPKLLLIPGLQVSVSLGV